MNPKLKAVLSWIFGVVAFVLMLLVIIFLIQRLIAGPSKFPSVVPGEEVVKAGELPPEIAFDYNGKRWTATIKSAPLPPTPSVPEQSASSSKIVVEVKHQWVGPMPTTFFSSPAPK